MDIISLFTGATIFGLFLKLFGIVVGFLYLFYTWIIISQIRSLEKTIEIKDDGLLITLAYIQLILATVIVLFALFIL